MRLATLAQAISSTSPAAQASISRIGCDSAVRKSRRGVIVYREFGVGIWVLDRETLQDGSRFRVGLWESRARSQSPGKPEIPHARPSPIRWIRRQRDPEIGLIEEAEAGRHDAHDVRCGLIDWKLRSENGRRGPKARRHSS
jgi:hypothetical protein